VYLYPPPPPPDPSPQPAVMPYIAPVASHGSIALAMGAVGTAALLLAFGVYVSFRFVRALAARVTRGGKV
jgi:hypothetical protein